MFLDKSATNFTPSGCIKASPCGVGFLIGEHMENTVQRKGWSPYLAGFLTGILMIVSVFATGKYFGASTSFVRTAGMIEKVLGAERVERMDYFVKETPKIDWQWMFVVGIFFGSLIASVTSGTFLLRGVPDTWKGRFGPGWGKRAAVAFSGGVIAMFGARLAGG